MTLDTTITLRQVTIRATMLATDPTNPAGDPVEQDRTGQATFTASATGGRLLASGATPPTSLGLGPRVVPFTAGVATVNLQTTDDADFTPTDWTWHVEFDFTDGGPAWEGFDFQLPADTSPLDLTAVTPISASGGVLTTQGPPGPTPSLVFEPATTVAPGGSSTVTATEPTPGTYNITLGLVKGDKGDKGDVGPAGLNWDDTHPTWDATKQYAVHDAVYYGGSSYFAVAVPTVGAAPDPDLTTPWEPLAIMGQKGDKGDAATVDVGTATTGAPGSPVAVTNAGSTSAAVLDFTIPAGAAATVDVDPDTITGEPGSPAAVVNTGTTSAAMLKFTVPQGPQGAPGADGVDAYPIAVAESGTVNPASLADGTLLFEF